MVNYLKRLARGTVLMAIFSIYTCSVKAQDLHLSQYYTNNQFLNPAWTGNYDGDLRFTANNRTQWWQIASAPIQTNMFAIEKKIPDFSNELSFGVIFMDDRANMAYLRTHAALFSISYQLKVGQNLFRLGAQGGMTARRYDFAGQTYPDQWNYAQGDYSGSHGETFERYRNMLGDFNAGAGWIRTFGNTKVSAGYAVFNIIRPEDAIFSLNRRLPLKHSFNAEAAINTSSKLCVTPHIFYMHTARAMSFIAGTRALYQLNDETGIILGGGFRGSDTNGDAVIGTAGFLYGRLQFAFSYDINVSLLSKHSGHRSAAEFSIIYTTPGIYPSKKTIPCHRY
ncbi:PorP/SprF family type IX secretion system membrane protein [Cytophagaceae bacterium ABcell3]|nr:PorP/SprF family type IX secretion system membrane protein [Cytophagaceae bacterium ABcell3]